MKFYILLFSLVFTVLSCDQNGTPPDEVLAKATSQLNKWQTLSFTATTRHIGNNKASTSTVYKLKKVNYEPHLKLFFFKEMNKNVSIYYKLASLAVVEDQKKKITTFDYGNDRSIPKYLEAYMGDDDNLLVTTTLMNDHINEIIYDKQSTFNDRKAYIFKFKNYKLWLDVDSALPLKFEIDEGTSGKKEIVYDVVAYNEPMEEELFTHPDRSDYVSSVYGVKKEPMLHTRAPDWSLADLEGKQVSLNDFKGRPIFLEAWVSSCSHCMESLPKIKQIAKEFGHKVNVVTVNFDYDLAETNATVKAENIDYLVLQGNAVFDQNYDLQSYPSYFVINSDGTIMFSERGTIAGKKEQALFEALRQVN